MVRLDFCLAESGISSEARFRLTAIIDSHYRVFSVHLFRFHRKAARRIFPLPRPSFLLFILANYPSRLYGELRVRTSQQHSQHFYICMQISGDREIYVARSM